MPHVIVKLWPGKSERQKARLAQTITRDVMDVLDYGEESVSVALEEIASGDWMSEVYEREIAPRRDRLHRKPGYGPRR